MEHDDLLPDSLLEKHGVTDTGISSSPAPAADDDSPLDDDDHPHAESDDLFEDTEEEEAGDDEPEDDLEDEGEDIDDLDDDEDDDLDPDEDDEAEEEGDTEEDDDSTDFLKGSKFDRRDIEKIRDPEARRVAEKAYKSFHAAFTRKTQEIAEQRREAEQIRAEYDRFTQAVTTPEGAKAFVRDLMGINPQVIGAVFEDLATGDGAEQFFLEAALATPEAFEAAYQRFLELEDDPAEKQRFTKEREIEARDRRTRAREQQLNEQQRRARSVEIATEAQSIAGRLDIDEEDFGELVIPRLRARIAENVQRGRRDISTEEIEAAVKEASAEIERREKRIADRLKARSRKERKEEVRKLAQKQRRPAPPRGGSKVARAKRPKGPPPGVDPLDFAVDTALARQMK